MSYASELIAIADSMSGDWGLVNSAAAIGTLYPSYLTSAEGPPIRPTFPAWLQKRSTMNKANRLSHEMYSKMRAISTCNHRSLVTTNYHDLLHKRLLQPLQMGDTKACATNLVSCGLTREFFTDQAPALRIPLGLDDGYKKLEGRHKSQLLADLNDLVQSSTVSSSKKRKLGGGGGDNDDGDEGGDDKGGEGDDMI